MRQRKTGLITHTGSDMPLEEARELDISVIPDRILFGDSEYRNMVDITPDAFYHKLENDPRFPTSSRPTTEDYMDAFRQAAQGSDEILCLMITSKMSSCYSAAVSAAAMMKRRGFSVPIYIYDTQQCSHGMAQMVREAGRLANLGRTADEIMKAMDELQPRIGVYFVLESLKNPRKGGRVGAIKALTADMLGIKPLLMFSDGLVRDFDISKGFNEGISRVVDMVKKEADFDYPVTVFHASAPARGEEIKKQILSIEPNARILVEFVGPVIGIYTGKGCVGTAFTKKNRVKKP